jgi:hypothetical protein
MYVLNQKINNLEEKTSVLDNFSQSIFQFITQKEESRLKEQEQEQEKIKEVVYSNQHAHNSTPLTPINEEETETEDHHYNVNNTNSGEKISETFESKEILSDMVDQLKESVIKSNNENLENELQQIQELKQELSGQDQEEESQNNLFNILSSAEINTNNQEVKVLDVHVEKKQELSSKKKEEELNKMSLTEIKALAKIKNISVMKSNKPKKKELLIQELLVV